MAGRGGARPGAGRAKGGKNRATIAREIVEKAVYEDVKKRTADNKQAVHILEQQMMLWMGVASRIQTTKPLEYATDKDFRYAMDKAMAAAAELAQYQTPKLKAIAVHEVPRVPSGGELPAPAQPGDGAKVINSLKHRTQAEASAIYMRMVRGVG